MHSRIPKYESEILDKLALNLVSELWEVISDQIQYESAETKSDFAKIFCNIIYGSECIDPEQVHKFDKYLKDVVITLGVHPDKCETSSVYENTINLRRVFLRTENFISHHAKLLSSLQLQFQTPSQQSIFDHLDPKFRNIMQKFQRLDPSDSKNAGLKVIQEAFAKS